MQERGHQPRPGTYDVGYALAMSLLREKSEKCKGYC